MVTEAVRIRVIRAITGMDQKTFATRCGVKPNTIYNWERGNNTPQAEKRLALAAICQEHKISIQPDGFPVPVE